MPSTIASLGVCSVRCPVGRRTESGRAAYGIWSGGVRNLVGWRTESDWAANAIWSGGVRNTMMVRVMFDNPTADSTARVLPLKSAALAFRLPTSSIYSVSLRNGWIQKKVTRGYDFLSSLFGISLRSGTSFRC